MKKVLIAEDDIFIRDIAETKLTESGYEVHKTADGGSVVNKMKEVMPDILLLDLLLPNKHGFSVLEEIRAEEAFKDTPVLVFSNENGEDVEARAKELGAEYFFKALTGTGELVKKVEEILG